MLGRKATYSVTLSTIHLSEKTVIQETIYKNPLYTDVRTLGFNMHYRINTTGAGTCNTFFFKKKYWYTFPIMLYEA